MKTLIQCFVTSTLSLGALAAFSVLSSACTITPSAVSSDDSQQPPSTLPDGALVQPTLPFVPSNVAAIAAHDLSSVTDVTLSSDCTFNTDPGTTGAEDCASAYAVEWIETQADGSQAHVFAFNSLSLAQTATLKFRGSLPAIVIAFHDMTLSGTVIASVGGTNAAGPGGFSQDSAFSKGGGPGGGPSGVKNGGGPAPGTGSTAGISAGGGSFCGLGAQGTQEGDTAGALTILPVAATPAYGTSNLIPLVAGSSGGTGGGVGGSGGGAVQLIAGGKFTLGNLASINAGGGGGNDSGETNAAEEASGGGSGGAVLIEAMTATIDGAIAANGGGGGGKDADGENASADANAALGGTNGGAPQGGNGGAAATINGAAGLALADSSAGAGGGGAGRVRINTSTGAAAITGTISPSATTSCTTQGSVVLVSVDAGH